MFRRLLLLLTLLACCTMVVRAQAPGTAERQDIDGNYDRPDLQAPLFDALTLPLSAQQVETVMHDLLLIVRNFPDSAVVNHRLRSHALAVALRLSPDDRSSVVANGQLARGVAPVPLTVSTPVTPEGVGQHLFSIAFPLLSAPEKSARDLALLLLDIARHLDPGLQGEIFAFTYGARPDWHDARPGMAPLDGAPSFQLLEAAVQVLLPGLDKEGELRTVTVGAVARPVPRQKGLKLALPEALRREMADPKKEPLRREVEHRTAALRAALLLRHEIWPEGWTVEISIPDAHCKALPQLFAGMALTMDSLLSNAKLDPRGLIAAGADPDGKLKSVLSLDDLLSGAALLEPPPILVLPPEAGDQMDDWLLMHPDQWQLLFRLTLHKAPAVADAIALLKAGRAPMLERSLTRFSEVAARLRAAADPLAELRRPETIAQLKEVTSWHPQHLSAAALLRVATGGPTVLSLKGSMTHIDRLARCVLSTDRAQFPLHIPRPKFEKSDFGKSGDNLRAAIKILHPSVRAYAEQVVVLAGMLDRVAGNWKAYLKDNGPPDPPQVGQQRVHAAELRAAIPSLNP